MGFNIVVTNTVSQLNPACILILRIAKARYGTSLLYLRPNFPSFHNLGGLLTKSFIRVYHFNFLCLTTVTIVAEITCYEVSRYAILSDLLLLFSYRKFYMAVTCTVSCVWLSDSARRPFLRHFLNNLYSAKRIT